MAWIYWNEEEWIISLSSDGETWLTIADKNLGATQVYEDGDTLSEANCWKFYQWWNNYGFPWTGYTQQSQQKVNATNYWPWNYYSSATFTYNPNRGTPSWDEPENNNLWWGTTNTNAAMKWPCEDGFHVPTDTELSNLINLWVTIWARTSNWYNNIKNILKLPFAWYISWYMGQLSHSSLWYYWSSKKHTSTWYAYTFDFYDGDVNGVQGARKADGRSIRPFANAPVVPDYNDTWTKLYWDDLPDRPSPPEPELPKLKRIIKHNNYYFFWEKPTHASGITLNKNSITLNNAWDTEQLTATVTPEDAVNKKVLWSSSDTSVATVSSTGLVTCVTPWECVITCTAVDGGASTTCEVIHSIPMYIDFLLVAWGWWWWSWCADYYNWPWGWWAGWVIQCCWYLLPWDINVVIWSWWAANTNWWNSCFWDIVACGWWRWWNYGVKWWNWWSWGWWANWWWGYWEWIEWQWWRWWIASNAWWWWGWASAVWWSWDAYCRWWYGWDWIFNDFSWDNYMYAWWGWGYWYCWRWAWWNGWWWAWWCVYVGAANASYYWWWWGWNWWCWYQWIFIARYPTACWYNITWWCKYICDNYTIHCFTSDWTLTVN